MKSILKQLILRFQENGIPEDLIDRDIELKPFLKTKNAIVITGPRRAGKTYLMFQFMKELKIPLKQVVYINFEDNVLVDFIPKNFEDILEAYNELYHDQTPYFFLDEIHVVKGWELFVRKLVDNGYRVLVTGSNAQLLSKEYASSLGGRYLEFEIFTLSFSEFLKFNKITYDRNILYSSKKFHVLSAFEEYLHFGGFPEVTLAENNILKEKLIDAYFKTAFFRDIIDRFKIRDESLFEIVLKKTAENVGKPFSFRSIRNKLINLDYNVSSKTIVNYYDFAVKGYLLLPSLVLRESVIKKEKERKMYFVDNGYLQTFYLDKNLGQKLENSIATNLVINKIPLRYFRNTFEIDFVLPELIPVQVTIDVHNEKTLKREIGSLIKFLNFTGKKVGYLLTMNESQTIVHEDKQIEIMPAWYFLLFFKNLVG